jgi:hypothetical protein
MLTEIISTADRTINQQSLSLFSDNSRFPFIPKTLPLYVITCVTKKHSNRLVEAVRAGKVKVFENINQIFELACKATGLSPDDLLRKTDFNVRDMSPTRLDSTFAEIRTINFLKERGFENIQPLKAGRQKKADILCTLHNAKFAVEVANSIFTANKRVEPYQLRDWLVGRAISDRKTEQLAYTS